MEERDRFEMLFRDTFPAVSRYAYHCGLSGAEAEDLVAGVFEVAWRKLDAIPVDHPVPWLLAVARNLNRNRLRSQRRRAQLVARIAGTAGPEPTDAELGADVPEIVRALKSLPPKDQELLRLIAWDGLLPTEAAEVLGCSANAVRVRLHRARRRLIGAMQDETRDSMRTFIGAKNEQEG